MRMVLHADCVAKRFGARRVLTSASVSAGSGTIVGLLGRNGEGKSTLLKICAGLMRPEYGQVSFEGERLHQPRLHQLARKGLCYLPSDRNLFSSSFPLAAQFAAVCRQRGIHDYSSVVNALELEGCLEQSPLSLSGGEKRRASVAMSCLLASRCLLADEPLRGIDPKDQERILLAFRELANHGCAIVLTGHEAQLLLHAVDRVVWMTAGTTHDLGSPHAARQHWQFSREFLGITDPVVTMNPPR